MSAPLRLSPQGPESFRVETPPLVNSQANALDVGTSNTSIGGRLSSLLGCPNRHRGSEQSDPDPGFDQAFEDNSSSFISIISSGSDPEEETLDTPVSCMDVALEVSPSVALDWRSELDNLQSIQRTLLAGLIQRLEFQDWESHSSDKELQIHRRLAPGGAPGRERDILMFRIERVMRNAVPRDVFALLMDAEGQPVWNTYCSSSKDHGDSHGTKLVQTCFKGLYPVSAREALEFRAASGNADAETLWIVYSSVGTTELEVPVTEKHERSFTMFSGYLLRPGSEPNTVAMTFISHIDAGGNLPDWIMAKAGPKGATDVTRALQVALDKIRRS